MSIKIALATVADSRSDFYAKRQSLVEEELKNLDWLRHEHNLEIVESGVIRSHQDVENFAEEAKLFGAQTLIIHIPIWSDPIFSVKLHHQLPLPLILMGNSRPETSSIVGLLGAGGALDQIGTTHTRFFDYTRGESRQSIIAFVRAVSVRSQLKGQVLGLFGGRSLGIFTAVADPAQWQQQFGVDIEYIDQMEIVKRGNELSLEEVEKNTQWMHERLGSVQFGGLFTPDALDRQIRSYIATQKLIEEYGINFVGVKCQSELSDGYATQCVSHMLMNGNLDVRGDKVPIVHACESDADGALSMQILHLLSQGKPAALLDIRWFNHETGIWTLANCGAIAASFFATEEDESGLSNIHMVPHVFGKGGGGALPAVASPQKVTLARLCRRGGKYWMAIVSGSVEQVGREELQRTTNVFPQAFIKSSAGEDFLAVFGSNHIHMVSGDFTKEVVSFCDLMGIPYELWI